jgi:hypothetical protein
MSPVGFEMTVDGVDAAVGEMRDLVLWAEDMSPAMRQVKALLIEGHRQQFQSKGGYLGTPWPANAEATIARKARHGIPSLSSTMVEEGSLQEAAEGGRGSRSRATKSMASAGVSLFYARFHINPKRAGMPARPVVGIHPKDEAIALRLVENRLMGRTGV